VATATEYFPSVSLGLITAVLTAFTLFFGELLPKALAVSNSELVARKVRLRVKGERAMNFKEREEKRRSRGERKRVEERRAMKRAELLYEEWIG
jgi:Cyclin M transmembrane N-terminal domain